MRLLIWKTPFCAALWLLQCLTCESPYVEVDLDRPDQDAFPELASLAFTDCVLEPGQMLYVPPKWWHYVKALAISFSVSFWWQ